MSQFSPKDPTETETFTFDFTSRTGTGETILSALVTVDLIRGYPDVNMAAMVDGSAVVAGTKVQQLITGGLNNNTYRISCTATTSGNQVLVIRRDLPVQETE